MITSKMRHWDCFEIKSLKVWATGWAYLEDVVMPSTRLAEYVSQCLSAESDFEDILDRIDGNFALITWNGLTLCAGVDHIRSIPLLYRDDNRDFMISDDSSLVIREGNEFDKESIIEFAAAGLVSGQSTLYKNLKSLQAGEVIRWEPENPIISKRYYEWKCNYDSEESEEALSYEHFEIIKDVFRRFVNFLDGRQVVVALSGGLDSKLVVGMLRYFEYENVLCYTYGKGNSREAIKAEAVSEQFGYNWILTEYSGDMWKQTLRDKDLHKYWASATNGVSLPHCWDWPSLKMIKRMDIVDEDAVFVTGISGDFVAGNHLKNIFDPRYNRDPHDFIELMINKHYSLWLNIST